jgi:hypothetical protein
MGGTKMEGGEGETTGGETTDFRIGSGEEEEGGGGGGEGEEEGQGIGFVVGTEIEKDNEEGETTVFNIHD